MGLRYPSARWTRQPEERGVLCDCRVQLAILPHPDGGPDPGRALTWARRLPAPGLAGRRPCVPAPTRCRRSPPKPTGPTARPDAYGIPPQPAAAPTTSGIRKGLPHPRTRSAPAPAPTGRPVRCGRSRTPPSRARLLRRSRAWRPAPEAASRVRGGRDGVCLEGALQPLHGRSVTPLRLGVERDQ